MIVLGIDTSGNSLAVGIRADGALAAEVLVQPNRSSLSMLVPLIQEVLQLAGCEFQDLGLLAVTKGPGSWAGIRIGLETARILALTTNVPLIGVSSLMALATNVGCVDSPVLVIRDAKRSRAYAAVYDCRKSFPQVVRATEVVDLAKLQTLISPDALLVGDTELVSEDISNRMALDHFRLIRGEVVALLGEMKCREGGGRSTGEVLPEYCQPAIGD